MQPIRIRLTQAIACPPDLARRHFLDMEHHQRHPVHAGARFEVVDQSADHSDYLQINRFGPFELRERSRLDREGDTVVNRCLEGASQGLVARFQFRPRGPSATEVVVDIEMPRTGARLLLAPVLRRLLRQGFARALEEDRVDLEERGYPRP